jgi:LEA14-like dessication related protein
MIQKPTASIKGISFDEVTLEAATLLFDVEINNPYPVDLPLLDMNYVLNSEDKKLFSGSSTSTSKIPAKDKATVPIKANISYLDVVKAFKGIRPGKTVPYNADVKLKVDAPGVGAIPIPIKKSGQIKVPDIPDIDKIDWGSVIEKVGNLK